MKHIPKEVYKVLFDDEEVKFALKQRLYFEAKPKWLFVTNYRIIYIDLNIGGFKSLDVPYEELKVFEFNSGILFAKAIITDEKGNHKVIPMLRRPSEEEYYAMVDYITERVQEVSVENPTISRSQIFFIRKFKIQKAPESAGRVKMQYVTSVTEGVPGKRMESKSDEAPDNLAKLTYEEAKKIVFEENKRSEQIKVLKDLFDNKLIDKDVYNQLKKEIIMGT